MRFSHFIRKPAIIFCCCSLWQCAWAQHQFRFFPIKGLVWEQQGFIGKLGSHFFLLNQQVPGLELYLFDSGRQTGSTISYPFPRQLMSVASYERSILFMSSSQDKGVTTAHFLELDESGNQLLKKEIILPLQLPVNISTSADKKHILFFQQIKSTGDSSFLRGVLLGRDGEIKKQLAYRFRYSGDLDMEPQLIIDNHGNTHILVADKPTNYRMSADLTLNTIPVAEEQIVSETFNFSKVKLKDLHVFQNDACDCIQAEGLYVDGISKENKGIYSMAFPLGRKNELAPRFIPFSVDMIKNFRQGFSATPEAILQSLELEDIITSDSGSFALIKLASGIPQKVQTPPSLNDPSVNSLGRTLAISRAGDNIQLPTSPFTPPRTRLIRNTQADRYANAAPIIDAIPQKRSSLSSRASARNAPKLIWIRLEKGERLDWHSSRSLDVFSGQGDLFNRQFVVAGDKENLAMILYQADALDEPQPVFITSNQGKQQVEKFPEKKLVFSPLQYLHGEQYGSLYLKPESGEGGILLIEPVRQRL